MGQSDTAFTPQQGVAPSGREMEDVGACVGVCGLFYYRGKPICGVASSSPMPATARGAARCKLGPAALPQGKNLASGGHNSGSG